MKYSIKDFISKCDDQIRRKLFCAVIFFRWNTLSVYYEIKKTTILLKSDSHLPKKIFLFVSMIALDEKCFLFHLKSYFRSQNIKIFCLGFMGI